MIDQYFKRDQIIVHPKFGEGTILGYVEQGYRVNVQFKNEVRNYIPSNLKIVLERHPKLQPKLPMPEDSIKVLVTYPDGKNEHTSTIGELKERFKEETAQWLMNFLFNIINTGKGYSNFGEYTNMDYKDGDYISSNKH